MARRWSKAPILSLWAGENEGQGRSYVDPTSDPDPKKQKKYSSVTTILKLLPKNLEGWAALKVAELAVERYNDLGKDPEWVMKWLPYAHNEFRDERAWVGSGVHAAIESEHKGTFDDPELDEEQERIMDRWDEMNAIYDIEPMYTECTVLNTGANTMGTADGIWKVTDRVTGESWTLLVDIKTSKSIWPGHEMQLGALRNADWLFIQVPEGTEGAALRKWKNPETEKTENTWWTKIPMPHTDAAAIVHLREDKFDLIIVENDLLHLRYRQFVRYSEINDIEQQVKELSK